MKKPCLALIAFLSVFQFTYAQWTTSGSNIYNSNTGNVGIATTTPTDPLQVNGNVRVLKLGLGGSAVVYANFLNSANVTGATTSYANFTNGIIQSDVTTAVGYISALQVSATSAVTNLHHYTAEQGAIAAGGSIANQYGFSVSNNLTGATNNFGFYGSINAGTGRWNAFMAGTANNYFGGNVGIGTGATLPLTSLEVSSFVAGSRSDNLALSNEGASNGSGTALYMGYITQNSGLGTYGARILQTGNPFSTRSSDLAFQIHGAPANNLDSSWVTALFIQRTTANVGIGTTTPLSTLDIKGGAAIGSYAGATTAPSNGLIVSGNVGIGKTNPQDALDVNGTIHSKQVNVDLSGWSDYVFNKDYHLPSLAETEAYINQNHHLAEIPSAAEITKNGLDLGEMNKLLLKKVEELTLYLIEKDKEIKELKQQQSKSDWQQEQIDQLKNQMDLLVKNK
jgi:hypothetical protein